MTNEFNTFTDAYTYIVSDIITNGSWVEGVKDPLSVGSDFGKNIRKTKEILGYSFSVLNPRARFACVKNRKINSRYALANFLWTLLGNRIGELIIPFNSNGRKFLDENHEIHSAIGPHIFKLEKETYFEFQRIEDLIRKDPSTRRAVIQLFHQDDLLSEKRDVPCYNHIQFFLRNRVLHCHVVMRSQSALMVMPYDFYLFSMLHEALAVRLKVELGRLYYMCNSIHIYDDEIAIATSMEKDIEPQFESLIMVDFKNETIDNLRTFFYQLSDYYLNPINKNNPIENLHKYNLDFYWSKTILNHFT